MTNIPNDQFAPSTRSRVDENHAGSGWAALVTRHLRRVLLKKIRHWSLGILWSLAHCVIWLIASLVIRRRSTENVEEPLFTPREKMSEIIAPIYQKFCSSF